MLGLTIGLRTLRAAQYSIDVVGQNVANATTPGYARRLSQLVTTEPQYRMGLGFGTGVAVADLRRIHDGLLELHLREQRAGLGRLDAAGGLLRQLDSALREPGENGLAARLDDLWSGFSDLTVFPDDPSYRAGLAGSASALAASFRDLAAQIDRAGAQATQSAQSAVDAVNTLLTDLALVNRRALQSRGLGGTPPDLQDERDRVLGELSDWVRTDAIERPDGTVDVLIDGRLMVSGDRARALAAKPAGGGSLAIVVAGTSDSLEPGSGALRGYLDFAAASAPQRRAQLDQVARALMLEVNRLHTTAASGLGPYASLVSAAALAPDEVDAALSTVDLPFSMQAGRLVVNVVESATGALTQRFVDVDPDRMSLRDLAAALDAIDHLSASVDSAGRLRVAAEAGFGFDFASRLDGDPDEAGSFGSDHATLTSDAGPFALSNGDTITLAVNGGAPVTVTFNTADFVDIGAATAAEVAAVIEAQVAGLAALDSDGRLVLQSDAAGAGSSIAVTATSNPVLFGAGTSDAGAAPAVQVQLSGAPTGGHEGRFTVRALGDGVIGSTAGLTIEVLDQGGASLGTLEVGAGYVPGDPLELVPGVTLTLSAGAIEQSAGDVFEFDLVGDGDTADALVALQLGAFFTGRDASDVALASELAADPRRIAGSRTGAPGDGSAFAALLALKDQTLTELADRSIAAAYGDLVAGVGFDVSANGSAATSQAQLLTALEARRDEISGVNTDEEMVNLLQHQHLYQAASRYLQTVNEVMQTVFDIL